jgi:hypothetical protein
VVRILENCILVDVVGMEIERLDVFVVLFVRDGLLDLDTVHHAAKLPVYIPTP